MPGCVMTGRQRGRPGLRMAESSWQRDQDAAVRRPSQRSVTRPPHPGPAHRAPQLQAHSARYPDGRAYEVRVRVVSPLKTPLQGRPQAAWAEEVGKLRAALGEGAATDP